MPGFSDFDYSTEQGAINRRLAIAQAMQQGGLAPLGPTESIGGVAIKQSPLQGLAKLAQVWAATKQIQSLDDQRRQLGQRYREDAKAGISDLINGLGSTAGQVTPEVQGNNPSAYVPAQTMTAQDALQAKRNAVLNAIGSGNPMVQQIGQSYLGAMLKDQMTMKDWLALADKFDPKSVVAAAQGGGMGALQPHKQKPVAIGDILIDPDTHEVIKAQGATPSTETINGDLYQRSPTTGGLKKLDNAPKITTKVTVPVQVKGEGKFLETLGEDSAKNLIKVRQERVEAQRQIQSMQKLEQLDRQGVLTGPGAKIGMVMGSLADAMGIPVDKTKLANSQAYQGELMANMQNYLTGSMARSTTDKDAEMLMAPLPQLLNTPEGRAVLRRQIIARAQEKIQRADEIQQRLQQQFPEAGRLTDLTPGSEVAPQRSDLSGKPTVSNW